MIIRYGEHWEVNAYYSLCKNRLLDPCNWDLVWPVCLKRIFIQLSIWMSGDWSEKYADRLYFM